VDPTQDLKSWAIFGRPSGTCWLCDDTHIEKVDKEGEWESVVPDGTCLWVDPTQDLKSWAIFGRPSETCWLRDDTDIEKVDKEGEWEVVPQPLKPRRASNFTARL
jgi:hypothetical protein